MLVYVVTTGCYSDYGIEAIFSSKEKAKELLERLERAEEDYPNIEEWTLDSIREEHQKDAIEVNTCSLRLSTGNLLYSSTYKLFNPTKEGYEIAERIDRVDGVSYKSIEHAQKLAVEGRQAWLRKKTENG